MPPVLAWTACALLVLVLLCLERTRNPPASFALWIPLSWMLVAGSRPVGRWIGGDLSQADGSGWDRLFLAILLSLGIVVCVKRRVQWARLLLDNALLIVLFLYLAASILWVEQPFVSFKRWIRSVGPIVMALVVLSEKQPLDALASILRRCAYILIPFSVVLIRYYPHLGRAYHSWTGVEMWTGVATHKNSLGQLCAVSAFFLIWSLVRKGRGTEAHRTRAHVCADVFVLAVALYLLIGPGGGSFSATSLGILIVGVSTFFALSRMRPMAAFVTRRLRPLTVVLVVTYWLSAGAITATVSGLFGRNEDLTGRATEIWPQVLAAAARHPVLGAGYGGVWGLGGELESVVGVEQAHNGYLDVYLELGIVGLCFLGAFLLHFCGRVRRQFRHDSDWGLFGLCILLMTLIYNMSESAFFDVYLATTLVLVTMTFSSSLAKEPPHTPVRPSQRWRGPIGVGRSLRPAVPRPQGVNSAWPGRPRTRTPGMRPGVAPPRPPGRTAST